MSKGPLLTATIATAVRATMLAAICGSIGAGAAESPTSAGSTGEPDQKRFESEARAFALDDYLLTLRRLQRVSYRLLAAAGPLCPGQQVETLGPPPLASQDLPASLRRAFKERGEAGTESLPRFHLILSDTPYAAAGITEGDTLQGIIVADGKQAKATSNIGWRIPRSRQAITLQVSNPILLTTTRKSETRITSPDILCNLEPVLVRSSKVFAELNGNEIRVSSRLVRELAKDDELAQIIAQRIGLWLSPENLVKTSREENALHLSVYLTSATGYQTVRTHNAWHRLALVEAESKDAEPSFNLETARKTQQVLNEIRLLHLQGKRTLPPKSRLRFSITSDVALNAASPPVDRAIADSTEHSLVIDPRLTDLSSVPYVNVRGLTAYQRFLDSPIRPRAFVIGYESAKGMQVFSFRFGADAAAVAIGDCKARLPNGVCRIYALDEQVVWDNAIEQRDPSSLIKSQSPSQTPRMPPQPSGFASLNDLKSVPVSADDLQSYATYLAAPSPKAFLVFENRTSKFWLGPTAMESALLYCENSQLPCWLYAVDNNVVWQTAPSARISRRDQLSVQPSEADFLQK